MATIYLIRHASPDRTRIDLPYHLLPGPPLTGQGVQEAHELGEFLRQAGVTRLVTSPLERCLQTAQIAAEVSGAVITIEPQLKEWQPEVRAVDVRQRMRPVFETAYRSSQIDDKVALVTHGGPIGALLEELGMPPDEYQKLRIYDYGNPLPPAAAWSVYRETEDQAWKLSPAFIPKTCNTPLPANLPGSQLPNPN